jgi:hypothetical protein
MDAQLGAEAEAPRAFGVGTYRIGIAEIRGRAIDWCADAGHARRQYQLRTEIQQLVAIAGNTKVDLEIERAECHAGNLRRLADLQRIPESVCAFDDRQQHLVLAHVLYDQIDFAGTFAFRQHDAGHAGVSAQLKVIAEPLGLRAIDPHQHRHLRIQESGQRVARRSLVRDRHCILKVDDHRMRAGRQRLRIAFRPVARHEQIGSWNKTVHGQCSGSG